MKNPLSEEQIKELNEITSLPGDQQQARLQEFLKKLSPEQIEFLKKGQSQQCVFCMINEGKVPSRIIYQDHLLTATLDVNPANKGHIILFPRKHYDLLNLMPEHEVSHLLTMAYYFSKLVLEVLAADGNNIIIANGKVAGQNVNHVFIHVIPRYEDDGLDFHWDVKRIEDREMDDISELLRSSIVLHSPKEEKKTDEYFMDDERIP